MSLLHSQEKIGRAAFQAFLNISTRWKLKRTQQLVLLGKISNSTYYRWKCKIDNKENIRLSKDTLERISYLLGIYKALNVLLCSQTSADNWIYKNNYSLLLNGQTALNRMLAGNVADLADIRRYLDREYAT